MSQSTMIYSILQFLDENGFKESKHKLESESATYLDIDYVKKLVTEGAWEDLHKYISLFPITRKIVCVILKYKYLEAIDRADYGAATVILGKEMKRSDDLFSEMTMLLASDNLRESSEFRWYPDMLSAREMAFNELKKLIQEDPILSGKTQFPKVDRLMLTSQIKGMRSECAPAKITKPSELLKGMSSGCAPAKTTKPSELLKGMRSECAPAKITKPSELQKGMSSECAPAKITKPSELLKGMSSECAPAKITKPSELLKGMRCECKPAKITKPSELQSSRICVGFGVQVRNMCYGHQGWTISTLFENGANRNLGWNRESKTYKEWQLLNGQIFNGNVMFGSRHACRLNFGEACFCFSKGGQFLASSSEGQLSIFNFATKKKTILEILVVATVIAFHPAGNGIIAIGTQKDSVQIWDKDRIKWFLKGHLSRVSGLAFSELLGILVSAGNDGEVFIWDSSSWVKKGSIALEIPCESVKLSRTGLMFDRDQTTMVVVHESQLSIYDASCLKYITQLCPKELSLQIKDATFSADFKYIYAMLNDGIVCAFSYPALKITRVIYPTAYVDDSIRPAPYPTAIAAHPVKGDQISVGLTNGDVYVFELRTHLWCSCENPRLEGPELQGRAAGPFSHSCNVLNSSELDLALSL